MMNEGREIVRVYLVDDHPMVREGVRALLSLDSTINVVGEAGTAEQAEAEIPELRPHLVLLDVRLPESLGFEVCRRLKQQTPELKIVFLSAYANEDYIYEAIEAGGDGYLLKELGSKELVKAVLDVVDGKSILDPAVTGKVFHRIRAGGYQGIVNQVRLLSPQEIRVLERVAQGKTNKEIAAHLNLSEKTVKNYLGNLMGKLNLSRRSEAAAFYVRHCETND